MHSADVYWRGAFSRRIKFGLHHTLSRSTVFVKGCGSVERRVAARYGLGSSNYTLQATATWGPNASHFGAPGSALRRQAAPLAPELNVRMVWVAFKGFFRFAKPKNHFIHCPLFKNLFQFLPLKLRHSGLVVAPVQLTKLSGSRFW